MFKEKIDTNLQRKVSKPRLDDFKGLCQFRLNARNLMLYGKRNYPRNFAALIKN